MHSITSAPEVGARMPNFKFKSIQGTWVQINDYRHRCNLIVTFIFETESAANNQLLAELAKRVGDFTFEDANVLVVVKGTPEAAIQLQKRHKLPFPVLLDEDDIVPRQAGVELSERASAIYVLDRYGQLYAVGSLSDKTTPSAASEIVDNLVEWLQFVNLQCPECGVPEWPTT
jgi:peroxiredoxin